MLFLFDCGAPSDSDSNPPNILFIMSDDHAYQAISAFGSKLIRTPNIDRIAEEGVLFRNSFVTNSICAPSRAVLLTGKYSHLNGLRDNRDSFDGDQMSFPKILQENNYYTGMVGKWHLKTAPTGFHYWNVLVDQGEYYNPRLIENGDTNIHTGYTTNIITDILLESIENRDSTKPFCFLYHHKAPHRNWMPDTRHLYLYENEDLPIPETFYDTYETRSAASREQDMRIEDMFISSDLKLQPGYYEEETGTGGGGPGASLSEERIWKLNYDRLTEEQRALWDAHYNRINQDFKERQPEGNELLEWKYQRYIKDYLRCVASIDENIGRVLDYLDQEGLSENTIVIYTSDQGFYLGEHGWYDKRFMYEESLRMPLVMRFPKEVPPGLKLDHMVLNLDFAPTILDYARVEIPVDMQGASLRPMSSGDPVSDWRESIYYHYYEYPHGWHKVKRHYGVRTDKYKLIHFYHDIDAWELFDLQADPNELNNVVDDTAYRDIREQLEMELDQLRTYYQVPENEEL